MPSIKRRSPSRDTQASTTTSGIDDDDLGPQGPSKRPRIRQVDRIVSSEDELMSDTVSPNRSVRASSGSKRLQPVSDDDDDDDDEDGEGDAGVTTMDTSVTVSPTQSSSTFKPKVEPKQDSRIYSSYRRSSAGRLATRENGAGRDSGSDDEDGEDRHGGSSQSASEDELSDDGEDAEQLAERQRELDLEARGNGMIAESGVIEKIELINFMCHRHLTVNFQPQINFIVGNNGSGKSAILTGLSVALGGKASSTSRANSIKAFVKDGSELAQIKVWIKNKGIDAFRHGDYGDSIIVERRINADGGGSWKLKSSKEKTVSTKKDELVALTDHFNIQTDNPMNILTQDAARQFLNSSTPSDMYDFFLKGTQLHQLSEQYQALQGTLASIRNRVQKEEEILPDLQQLAHEAARRYQLMEKQKDFLSRQELLKNQLVWAQVVKVEKKLQHDTEQAAKVRTKIDKVEADIRNLAQARQTLNDKITELESRSKSDGDRLAPLHDERQSLKQQIQKLKSELMKVREKEGSINAQYTRLSANLKEFQRRIDEEAAKLAQDNQAQHNRLEARRQDLESRRRQLEEQKIEVREAGRTHEIQMKDAVAGEARAIDYRDRLRHEVQEVQTYTERLAAASKNSLEAYGPGIPELQRAINQDGRWHRKPVGPIGSYVKLKDAKWAPVLESVIGNTLNAFCVVDHHDRRILESLKQRLRCHQVPVLTGSDEAFDFSGGEPPADVTTILRVLDIRDDYVLRQLVNAVHIESSALVEHRPEGDQLMRRNVPNVKNCFSKDGFRLGGGAVGSSTQTLNRYKGPPRLSSDLQGKLNEAKENLEQSQRRLTQANDDYRKAQTRKRQLEEGARNHRQQLSSIHKKQDKVRDELAQLEDEVREGEPANVAAIEEARRDTREELDRCKTQFEEVQNEKDEVDERLKPLVARSEELKKQIDSSADEAGAIKLELTAVLRDRVQNQQTEKLRNETLRKLQADATALTEEIENGRIDVENVTGQALEYTEGERVEAPRSQEHYEREIQAVEKLIEDARRQSGGTLEEVTREYHTRSKAFQEAQKKVEGAKSLVKALRTALDIRVRMWKHFRHHIALSARSSFSSHLANRGYSGRLNFNHEAGRLGVFVDTGDNGGDGASTQRGTQKGGSGKDKESRRKDTKNLSGGEKSFSTICLLLALWQAIGCPIRCLDEFDVFMDAVNRKISMSMMIQAARKSPGIQYVLISPNSITNTKLGPEVHIQKLSDPERGQTTLNLGQE